MSIVTNWLRLNHRFTYVKKPLHTAQAKKVEEKAHEGMN